MIEQVRDAKLHWILDQYLAFFSSKIPSSDHKDEDEVGDLCF